MSLKSTKSYLSLHFWRIIRAKGAVLVCSLAHIALQERPYRNAIWAKLQTKMTHIARPKVAHFGS